MKHIRPTSEKASINASLLLTMALGFILLWIANTAGAGNSAGASSHFALVLLLCANVLLFRLAGGDHLSVRAFSSRWLFSRHGWSSSGLFSLDQKPL